MGTQEFQTITLSEAKIFFEVLVGREANIECGYGGVLYLEISPFTRRKTTTFRGKKTTRIEGAYRLSIFENWDFYNGTQHVNRWKSSREEDTQIFEVLGTPIISAISISDDLKQIIFEFEGGARIVTYKDDLLSICYFVLRKEAQEISIKANGKHELRKWRKDLESWKPPKYKRESKNLKISREYLKPKIDDLLPISLAAFGEIFKEILDQPIKQIVIDSGTTFRLLIGDKLIKHLGKNFVKSNVLDTHRWYISIEELWILKKNGSILLDVSKHRFEFEAQLNKHLLGKKIIGFTTDNKGRKTVFKFNGGYSIHLKDSGRYSSWDYSDRKHGISVYAERDAGLQHRLYLPNHLENSGNYNSGEDNIDLLLYRLDVYKTFFAHNSSNSNSKLVIGDV